MSIQPDALPISSHIVLTEPKAEDRALNVHPSPLTLLRHHDDWGRPYEMWRPGIDCHSIQWRF